MLIYNVILSLLILTVNYQLALSYIGVIIHYKKTIIPSLLLSAIAYTSKIVFCAPPMLHTIIIVIACTLIIHYLNNIKFIFSLVGSLLSFITLTLGSLLLACPLLIRIGIRIPNETNSISWIYLNLAEVITPTIVLIVLRLKKLSIVKALG